MPMLCHDGSTDAPKLKVYLNLDNLADLRHDSIWPGYKGAARDVLLAEHGFEGIQLTTDDALNESPLLPYCGLNRINRAEEADSIAAKHADRGDECLTVHAGWGMEDDDEMFGLVEAILAASDRRKIPILIETHRATITQDLWRTVQIARRYPELRFNGDYSHYYCGQELVYGDWGAKLAFMEPIFSQTGFLHGRIASGGCMQVPVDSDVARRPKQAHGTVDYLEHFKEMWTRAMLGFLRSAGPGSVLIFAPELLSGKSYYARLLPNAAGVLIEETDRYAQALLLQQLARSCFVAARKRLESLLADHADAPRR